jgi:hypothetical protein
MAENIPNPPGGALPPKPAEAAKVQPKKETVRINLPPKPTSAPTIKLPTLAPGAPAPSIGVSAAAAPAAMARPAAPAAPVAAAVAKAAPAASVAPRPSAAPAPVARGLGKLDMGLAIFAAVSSLAGLAAVVYLAWFLKDTAS